MKYLLSTIIFVPFLYLFGWIFSTPILLIGLDISISTAYFNTNVGIATVFFKGGGGGGNVSISSAAPTSPNNGDLW